MGQQVFLLFVLNRPSCKCQVCEEATLSRRPVLLSAHSGVRVPNRTADPYNFKVPVICFIGSRDHNSGNRLLFETD